MDLTRYDEDTSRPRVGSALRDAGVRVALPGVLVWGVVVGFGALLIGPWSGLAAREERFNRWLEARRTETWNTVTMLWSHVGNTEYVIAVCLVVIAVVWWRTRMWWFAVIPGIAISVQATIFVLATVVIDRDRPNVEHLDPAPPTSSYPSGHVGASTALYATLAIMATRIENAAVRRLTIGVCVLLPLLVIDARLYRGMHHITDVTVGMLNGIVCAVLSWHYLRRSPHRTAGDSASEHARELPAR